MPESQTKSTGNLSHNLSQPLYELLKSFYDDSKSSNGLIQVKLLTTLLAQAVKKRNGQIRATNSDINRILSVIDEDKDGFINLNELINMLSLLLAKKSNISKRVEFVLVSKDFGKNNGLMNNIEVNNFLDLLNEFYMPDVNDMNEVYKKKGLDNRFLILKTLTFDETTKLSCKLYINANEAMSINSFSKQIAPYYEKSLFLR